MIWVAVEDRRIAICNTNCQNQEKCYMETNNFPHDAVDLIKICSINKYTVVLGYANGVLVFGEHPEITFSQNSLLLLSVDLKLNKLQATNIIHCHSSLNDIELISNIKELWCGCESGMIEIVNFSSCNITNKNILDLQSQSSDITKNSAVLQIKLASVNVFALHRGNVLSCWAVNQHSLIKVISPNFQGWLETIHSKLYN